MGELLGEESAKAIGKVADVSNNVVDFGREFGKFFAKNFGGSIEQWAGLWEDKLCYRRWENQLALMQKTEEKLKKLGLEGKLRPLEMKIGVPLLEAASLEDNDYLRGLWANLLVNSVDNSTDMPHPAFIQVLQNLQLEEAKIIEYMYKNNKNIVLGFENDLDDVELAGNLMINIANEAGIISLHPADVLAWFDNLFRLRLLQQKDSQESVYNNGTNCLDRPDEPFIDNHYYKIIIISSFGKNFMKAVDSK